MPSNIAFAGSVPANYEQYLGPFLFEPYAQDLVRRLPARGLNKVLETACGTGRLTAHLVSVLTDKGELVATDLNPDMISVARKRVIDTRVDWKTANALELPFEDNYFDAVVCQYGVMFFPDKAKGFAEARRALKPGGRFIFNCWDSLENNPPVEIISDVLREEFGDGAPKFLEEAPYSFYDREKIRALMNDASFRDVEIEYVSVESSYSNADDIIKGFLDGTPLFTYLAEKEDRTKATVREKIRHRLIERFGETSDSVSLRAIVCEGIK